MFKAAGLRAGDAPITLKVRKATDRADRRHGVVMVARRRTQFTAGVMVMVKIMHHLGVLTGHVLCPLHLEAFPPPQEAAVLKHVTAVRVESPEAAFPRLIGPSGDLDEAVVEGEIVSQGVLPPLGILTVVGKAVHDELINVTQRQHLVT